MKRTYLAEPGVIVPHGCPYCNEPKRKTRSERNKQRCSRALHNSKRCFSSLNLGRSTETNFRLCPGKGKRMSAITTMQRENPHTNRTSESSCRTQGRRICRTSITNRILLCKTVVRVWKIHPFLPRMVIEE
jgi:hypothetical protein